MEWYLKWRDSISDGFYYLLLSQGKLKEQDLEPEVSGVIFYISAFFELSTCRVNGMSVGAIPFTAVVEYSKLYEVEDFDEFLYFIRLMDRKYLEFVDKKQSGGSTSGLRSKHNTNTLGNKR